MKRRDFIHNLSHAIASSAIFPHLNYLDISKNYSALQNTFEPGKILINLRFSGGNDSLNTITPMDQYATLQSVRPHVILPENKLVQLSRNDLAFHPELNDLSVLFEEKRMKIIQNVGYENPDLSHFRSGDIWETASGYGTFLNHGWLGRLVEHDYPTFPDEYPNEQYPDPLAIELSGQGSLLMTGKYSFPGFIVGNPDDKIEIFNDLDHIYSDTISGNKLKYIQLITKQSDSYSNRVKEAYERGNNNIEFPNTWIGGQFRTLARLIRGGLNTRIYHAVHGNFDTHDNQVDSSDHTKGQHAILLKEFNDAMISLMKALDETGDSDKVMIVTTSEFGRRIVSRSSGGTDHGTAFSMMIFGNSLNTKVAGKNQYIDPNVDWQSNLEAEFDFRQIYASIIDQWLGGDASTQKDVLFKEFDRIGITKEYADDDNDGIFNKYDECLDTKEGAIIDTRGCEIFSLPPETFSVITNSTSCIGENNGSISISSLNKDHSYSFSIEDENSGVLNEMNNYSAKIENLPTGTYNICIKVDGQSSYQRCYSVKITEPPALTAFTKVDKQSDSVNITMRGSENYSIILNGNITETNLSSLDLPLKKGLNTLKVSTNLVCQGSYNEEIFVSEDSRIFPNPTNGPIKIFINGIDNKVNINIFSMDGKMIFQSDENIPFNRMVDLDLSEYANGTYIITLLGNTIRTTEKILKI